MKMPTGALRLHERAAKALRDGLLERVSCLEQAGPLAIAARDRERPSATLTGTARAG